MCQSKAEGGRRCAFHLQQGVVTGMGTYASAVTRLNPAEINDAYTALESEGAALPDPTRAEVDDFLEQQIFRVRHEEELTEKRRESIVARLRAAVGRVLPNGATFHAWKNLVAESWSRVRRKAAMAFVAGALTFSMGACGNAANQDTTPATASPVAAAPAAPQQQWDETWETAQPAITAEAAAKFGPKQAAAATTTAVDFAMDNAYDDDVASVDAGVRVNEVLALRSQMTPECAEAWTGHVRNYASGPKGREESAGSVLSLTLYAAWGNRDKSAPEQVYLATEGPSVINPRVKSVRTSVETDGRLMVTINSSADMRVIVNGDPQQMRVDREQTLWMANTDDGWKIDGWRGMLSAGQYKPDKPAKSGA